MSLTYIKMFLCRTDVKIVLICGVSGGILQVIGRRYLKNHPEFLNDEPVNRKYSFKI